MTEYVENFGKVIVIIGQSSKGPSLEPTYALDQNFVERHFGRGEIVDGYQAVVDNGGQDIYLIRVRYNTDLEKYKNYNKAYEALQGLSPDVIIPTDFDFDETVIEYPSIFTREETVEINPDQSVYQLDNKIDDIEYVEINERMITNYNIVDEDSIEIGYSPPGKTNMFIRYNTLPKMNISYKVITYTGNQRQLSKDLNFEFDTNKDNNQKTDFIASDVFDFPEDEWDYMVTTDNQYIKTYTDIKGGGKINFIFDKEQYIIDNTEEKYFIKDLAVNCSYLNSVAIVKYTKDNYEQTISHIKEILNRNYNFGKYISVALDDIEYNNFISNSTYALAGLCGRYNTEESITNKPINGRLNSDLNSKYLSSHGYTTIVNTIRNGTGPYRAQTLGEGMYSILKVIRIINELSKRINKRTEKYSGRNMRFGMSELPGEIEEVIRNMKDLEKISDATFTIKQIDSKKIEIKLSVLVIGEIGAVLSNLIADIF